MLMILFLYAVLATSFTTSKAALMYVQPLLFTALRMIPAGIGLLGYAWWRTKASLWPLFTNKVHIRHGILFLLAIIFHIYVPYTTYFMGMKVLSSSKVALYFNLSPFFAAFFAHIFTHQRMTLLQWLGCAIGFFGMLPVTLAGHGFHAFGYPTWDEFLILCSVVSSAYGWYIVQRLVRDAGYRPSVVNGISMLCGGFLALLSSLAWEGGMHERLQAFHALLAPASGSQIPLLGIVIWYTALSILAANIIFYTMYATLLKRYSMVFLSFAGLITPLLVAINGWFFLGEGLPEYFMISFVLLSGGLYLFYIEELRLDKKIQK
jgi:drug/metabolite transporter (DMT)-like permease